MDINMRLPEFLKIVDDTTKEMNHTQLFQLIHELARTLPEKKRIEFLMLLDMARFSDNLQEEDNTLEKEVKTLIEKLESIQDGERVLDSEFNEEWDDWYNPDAPEFLFMDSTGILRDIELGINLVHKCIDMKLYDLGNTLVESLAFIEVETTGDCANYEDSYLDITKLQEYQCLNINLDVFCNECVFLSYMGNPLEQRAEKIYFLLEAFGLYSSRLESVMQLGKEELKDFDLFLDQWINYLGVIESTYVETLLLEAQALLMDEEKKVINAKRYTSTHPCMIKQVLENGEDAKNMFEIGKEALNLIPESYTIRSEISLLCAKYALQLSNQKDAESCWVEAFKSNTNLMNYWRIRLLSKNWNDYKLQVHNIFGNVYKKTKNYMSVSIHAQRENELSKFEYEALCWSEGRISEEMKNNVDYSVPLFLLSLNAQKNNSKGIQVMKSLVSKYFHVDSSFNIGTLLHKKEEEIIEEILENWRKEIDLNDLGFVERLIDQEVRSILHQTNRKQYWKCAAYISALGEVKGCKENIIQYYLNEYPRHNAFHREMKNYL